MSIKNLRPLNLFLRMAVIAGVESAVQLHINRGDNLNARDSSGLTPLMLSVTRNKAAICKLLLDAGVDHEMLDPSGKTAFDIAVATNACEIVAVFESAKAFVKRSSTSNPNQLLEDLEADDSLVKAYSKTATTSGNTLSNEVTPPALIAEKEGPLYPEEAFEFDLQGWEPEEYKPPPIADLSVVAAATATQQAFTEYVPIDSSADWDDVDAYLPETALPLARTGDDESRERLRLLLLRALREGSVPRREVEALTANHDRTANLEAESVLSMVINDLGAEVDERFEYANARENCLVFVKPEETPDEEEALSDALACIESLAARRAEPLRIYQKEFQQHPLISAEQEVLLAQAMEGALEVALDTLAVWPHGIGLILDAGRLVIAGEKSLTWMSRSPVEVSSDLDPAAENVSDEEETEDAVPSGSSASGDHALDFSDALKRLVDLPIDTVQQSAGWCTVRETLTSLRLSRQLLVELADAKDDKSPEAASEYAKTINTYQCAREQMTVANLKLAFHLAKKYLYSGEPLDDLAQEANIGLLKAVDRFDWRRGFKFSTYATWWIRQQISRYVADKCRTIRIPVHVHEKVQRLQRETQNLQLEMGRAPELGEIAARMQMPARQVAALQRLPVEPLSIHELAIDELIAVEVQSDFVSPDPMDSVSEFQLSAVVDKMLASLEIKEEQIIRLRYGIGIADALTLEEIGKRYEVTRERIRQIELKALRALKRPNRIGIFMQSVHGAAYLPEKSKQKSSAKQGSRHQIPTGTFDEQAPTPEELPPSVEPVSLSTLESSSVDVLFLQATELGAAIELDRKKRLGKLGIK